MFIHCLRMAVLAITLLAPTWAINQPAFQVDLDLPGLDYSHFDLPTPRPRLCQDACFNDARCRAWTFVRAHVFGPRSACWLKMGVPEARENNCCVSGVR